MDRRVRCVEVCDCEALWEVCAATCVVPICCAWQLCDWSVDISTHECNTSLTRRQPRTHGCRAKQVEQPWKWRARLLVLLASYWRLHRDAEGCALRPTRHCPHTWTAMQHYNTNTAQQTTANVKQRGTLPGPLRGAAVCSAALSSPSRTRQRRRRSHVNAQLSPHLMLASDNAVCCMLTLHTDDGEAG